MIEGRPEEDDIVHVWAREGGGGSVGISEGVNRGTEADYCGWEIVAPNIKGIEYSAPIASVWLLEHHHPTMSTLWGHRYPSKIK